MPSFGLWGPMQSAILWGDASVSLFYTFVFIIGLNLLLWGSIGFVRLVVTSMARWLSWFLPKRAYVSTLTRVDVAIIMPAYNEELVIARSIESLLKLVPAQNIYIISDGSTDRTADIARSMGVQVYEPDNSGKAGALCRGINHFQLASRYAAVLFVDADTIISPDYLKYALPYLEDARVAAVAGFAKTLWSPETTTFSGMFILAHRERVYILVQYLIKYAQAWFGVSMTPIVPGFCSLYRASILPQIDIAARGLVIEDYNMTFEIHKKKLGTVILDHRVYGNTQDPVTFQDYYKQVRRWHLGFWQTVRLHGFWPSLFSLTLLLYIAEVLLSTISLVAVPPLLLTAIAYQVFDPLQASFLSHVFGSVNMQAIWSGIALVLGVDYLLSVLVGIVFRRPQYLWYGLGFIILKYVDAWTFVSTLPRAFLERSSGVWISPVRRHIHQPIQEG
ncbi:MAG: glycosyltransferase family 2 protein [Candidatus Doudnabacteria bacterium]|nr:glycosyltransferase family 2 protein [Candidatus Doudnabacteria bacterium]